MKVDRNPLMSLAKKSGLYYVDTNGVIWTCRKPRSRNAVFTDRWIHQWRGKTTIYPVFSYQGEQIQFHLFVYFWFHNEIPVGMEVDHKDLDTFNTHPDNLELVSLSENQLRRWNHPKNAHLREHHRQVFKGRKITKEHRQNMRRGSARRWQKHVEEHYGGLLKQLKRRARTVKDLAESLHRPLAWTQRALFYLLRKNLVYGVSFLHKRRLYRAKT